ncbi:aldehyde dehydrogenase family protein [Arthrobacter crystallopoietes]|uniref:Aldehyde dehydrogenase (NAD+) n=1 Tax=Crystallibacter crystallopoietes TaxID=37928 RepID=A0A1H1AMP3_9MICC|nr:aldehyde dehydrogenase family protein [Arthrobacter crystallopoietes]AUI51468.1 aldehyde dehydrogenase [Arthrobacter crystallopoietes]SDQ40949.1 aldehyde dehydrogenase (NAD+) [Arthrobacter crystallopoietes]
MTSPVQLQHYIDGAWVPGTGSPITSYNPARPDEVVAQGLQAGPAEVEQAMTAAVAAKREWARTPAHERGAVLLRAAVVIEQNAEAWGLELAREEGKTRAEGRGEVLRAAQIFRYYGNDGDRTAGEIFSSPRRGEKILITRKPLGVVGVVTPFNFPIAIPAWKIAPALAYGNTVVWKPASTVPLLALRLAQALEAAGLPAGVLNLLIGPGSMGSSIVEHPALDGLTFTGSTGVGRRLAAEAAGRGVSVQAEMGGKNAAVVLADADLELAAEQVMLGAFRSTGQKCTATSRLIVAEAIADEFLATLAERANALAVGDPADPTVQMGPVVNDGARKSIRDGIDTALAQGARLIAGGQKYDDGDLASGYFIPPTILEIPADRELDVWREELFGPVLAVRRAASVEQAFELANDSEFGLSAALFTQDVTRALDAIDDLDVGILHVNSESAGADPHVPFGGAKKSGYGPKEQGTAAKEFFTHTTTVYLRGGTAGV